MSEIIFSHDAQADGGAILLEQLQELPCGFTVKAAVLDNRRKLIIEGWFHAADRDSEGGTLSPFMARTFPFTQHGEEVYGACFLQFEQGMFPVTEAVYCAHSQHVHITRELPEKRKRRARHLC